MKWTGKKLIVNMITTAINIFATFLLVLSWLSRFRFVDEAAVDPGCFVGVGFLLCIVASPGFPVINEDSSRYYGDLTLFFCHNHKKAKANTQEGWVGDCVPALLSALVGSSDAWVLPNVRNMRPKTRDGIELGLLSIEFLSIDAIDEVELIRAFSLQRMLQFV